MLISIEVDDVIYCDLIRVSGNSVINKLLNP